LMNVLIFLIVGLQLHPVLAALGPYSRLRLAEYALAIGATVIFIRFAWLFGQQLAIKVLRLRYRIAAPGEAEWKYRMVTAWAGFRGGVSLAAAIAIPQVIESGADFPRRSLTIFLTFGVIFVTLVGQGLTLPWLMTNLRLAGGRDTKEVQRTLGELSGAALQRLRALEREGRIAPEAAKLLRQRYEDRSVRYGYHLGRERDRDGAGWRGYDAAARELVVAQRRKLVELHRRESIDSTTMQSVETALDLQELWLDRLTQFERDVL